MKDVLRKGKNLCIVLQRQVELEDSSSSSLKKNGSGGKRKRKQQAITSAQENTGITGRESTLFLSLHMGMTGRISSPSVVPRLESLSENDAYPPPHTHLIIRSNGKEAAFSDPRRFGSVMVDVGYDNATSWSIPTFQDIAPDALQMSEAYCSMRKETSASSDADTEHVKIIDQLINKKKGIKGLLLDQRAVVSGIGNWVADELLYRCCIHPDQSFLNTDEAHALVNEMQYVFSTAIACSKDGVDYPQEWLFHRRWRNGGGSHAQAKDFDGNSISFVQSGGRSTAIVPSRQKHKARKSVSQQKKNDSLSTKKCVEESRSRADVHFGNEKEATTTKKQDCRMRVSLDVSRVGIESSPMRRSKRQKS